jgi:4-diphosphocytidyl-2-C-methyl-D-erythritol kinase
MADAASLARKAYAKLNLLLSVGSSVPSDQSRAGWHPIVSWMHCVDLYDEVSLERAEKTTLKVQWAKDAPRTSDIDWPMEKDLCVRAIAALAKAAGQPMHACISLTKRIPTQAGMGGGSSDAAATLLLARELFHVNMTDEKLLEVAMPLGSDVGFFLDGEKSVPDPAVVSGFGETIDRTPRLSGSVILVLTDLACSTPAVYSAYDGMLVETVPARSRLVVGRAQRMLDRGKLDGSALMNDLAKPAYLVEPRLGTLASALARATRENVHVTGSGAALFLAPPEKAFAKVLEKCQSVLRSPEFSPVNGTARALALA